MAMRHTVLQNLFIPVMAVIVLSIEFLFMRLKFNITFQFILSCLSIFLFIFSSGKLDAMGIFIGVFIMFGWWWLAFACWKRGVMVPILPFSFFIASTIGSYVFTGHFLSFGWV